MSDGRVRQSRNTVYNLTLNEAVHIFQKAADEEKGIPTTHVSRNARARYGS
jgi:hypothetical protein